MSGTLLGADEYIRAVTNFIFVSHAPEKCDAIFIPGSLHPHHIRRAAQLYREGYAPFVIPSGKWGITRPASPDAAYATEWAWMRDELMRQGVPEGAILREDQATYTWENAQFSRLLTDRLGLDIHRGMLCCRSFHARRALLYYQAAYPATEWFVCPGEEAGLSKDDWYKTPEGRARVLSEVRRLGDQVNEVFEGMFSP